MADMFPATTAGISTVQKIEALEREIKLREYVYPRRVASKAMSQDKADHELLVMQAILADYQAAK